MSKILGIDLGTTNSVVAVMEGGEPVVINTAEGSRLCPSVVAFNKTGERLVGQAAKRQAVINSENTVSSIKRFIGCHYDEVSKEKKMVPYQVVKGPAGEARVKIPVNGREYSPQEISAQILAKLKADAEAYLGEAVTKAVITVPAYFNDSQRQSTKDAGRIAGLEVLRIINEPTASALAYGLDKKKNEKILVFDLGGGTFDVSVLEVGEGVFEVKSTSGDTHLGGDDWDERIVNWAADTFKNEQGIDLREDKQASQRLREAAEKAKIELSSIAETTLSLPYITADANGPRHLDVKLNRVTFEKITADLLERVRKPFESALQDAGLVSTQVDEVVLVGGSTRMPMVQELVKKLTGKEPNRSVNPDEVVAVGAAIQAGVLAGEVNDVLLLDVSPLSLGLETLGGVMTPLIERNTTIPVRKSQLFSTAEDNQTAVDVHVLQGERPMSADNMSLGRFRLEGIPAAPRGLPQVEVTFDIDANGILNVSAKDRASQKEQQVTITASTNLSKEDIDRLMREAQTNKEGDENRRRVVEARNQADTVLYQTEKWLLEQPESDKNEVGALLANLKRASEGEDITHIQALIHEIEDAKQKYGQTRPAAESPENSQADQSEPNGEVVEGQFEEA